MRVALLRLLDVTKVQDGSTFKKRIEPPKRFVDEVEQLKPCVMKKKTPKKDNNLYDIEVTDDNVHKDSFC